MKKCLLFSIGVIFSLFVQGQSVHIGAGLAKLSNVMNSSRNQGSTYLVAYTHTLYKGIAIETGINYTQVKINGRSSSIDCGLFVVGEWLHTQVHTFQAPIILKVNVLPRSISDKWQLTLGGGLSINKSFFIETTRLFKDNTLQINRYSQPSITVEPIIPIALSRQVAPKVWIGLQYQKVGSKINIGYFDNVVLSARYLLK